MAEAEEVITDAARHATVFIQRLWRKHRPAPERTATLGLADITARTDLLLCAVFGQSFPLRTAQPPARTTLLSEVWRRNPKPRIQQALPTTDGTTLWLPREHPAGVEPAVAAQHYRMAALQQAVRARRGSAELLVQNLSPLQRDIYLVLEAEAADLELLQLLPGTAQSLHAFRRYCLNSRPPLEAFSPYRRPLEELLREVIGGRFKADLTANTGPAGPAQCLALAKQLIGALALAPTAKHERHMGMHPILKDWWTGDLRLPNQSGSGEAAGGAASGEEAREETPPRSAQLARRPEQRDKEDDEDQEGDSGILMVQLDEPHKHAEDPLGLQRPIDRDSETDAEEFGELLSELPQARLVSTPGTPKEVLLTDDPPATTGQQALPQATHTSAGIRYPEWDYRKQTYNSAGATVRPYKAPMGSQRWVDDTLEEHRAMLHSVRRRFEMLRAERVWQRRRLDGEEIDLDAFTDSYANYRAGGYLNQALYQHRRPAQRNMAITLLIDVSGSTDSWVSANRRVIDVEREALLMVCIALEGMGEPFSVQAFSGEGPSAVTVKEIKGFDEHYSNDIALRISALEPEHYTRAGTALRHASAQLMNQKAAHKLLLLLSDGKPNDVDDYQGRYGVEDMRQAVIEAKLQGIYPFCLTIDRQSANYLPRIFGPQQYALLPKPALLPVVLLDWMKRLLVG